MHISVGDVTHEQHTQNKLLDYANRMVLVLSQTRLPTRAKSPHSFSHLQSPDAGQDQLLFSFHTSPPSRNTRCNSIGGRPWSCSLRLNTTKELFQSVTTGRTWAIASALASGFSKPLIIGNTYRVAPPVSFVRPSQADQASQGRFPS